MQILKIATIVVTTLLASTAQADWDYTKWGQSLESLLEMDEYKIVLAAKDNVYNPTVNAYYGIRLAAFGHYVASVSKSTRENEYRSSAWSSFKSIKIFADFADDPQLTGIVIETSSYDDELPIKLVDRYGAPAFTRREQVSSDCTKRTQFWRDDQSGNNIRLIKATCKERDDLQLLIYSPILTTKNSRL